MKFKVRWVVKGYYQKAKIDFEQTFTIVVKLITFYTFFASVIFYNLDIKQIVVKIDFFYDIIDQFLYMKIWKIDEQ